jgi:hypothetical protein
LQETLSKKTKSGGREARRFCQPPTVWAEGLAFQNNELLPQSQILDEQVTTGAKGAR